METLTLELAVATGDPLDRTLSILARDPSGLVAHRAWRVLDGLRVVEVMYQVDRIILAWARPELGGWGSFCDLLDDVERQVSQPF